MITPKSDVEVIAAMEKGKACADLPPVLTPAKLPPPLPRTRPRWPRQVRQQRDPEDEDTYLGVSAMRAKSFTRELRHFGIDPALFAKCLSGEWYQIQAAQRELSSHILDLLAVPAEAHAVANKRKISPSLVGFIITAMLDAMQRKADFLIDHDAQQIVVVDELAELIKTQLVIGNGEHVQLLKSEKVRSHAIATAMEMITDGISPTIRKVAARMGVAPSTISRKFAGQSLIEVAREHLDSINRYKARRRAAGHKSSAPT